MDESIMNERFTISGENAILLSIFVWTVSLILLGQLLPILVAS